VVWNPSFDWDREGWREQAACRHVDLGLFFPAGSTGLAAGEIKAAKAVCGDCPVRRECLQFAFETNQESGIWGGKDENERHGLRRAWRGRQGYGPAPTRTPGFVPATR
jgi:WhiB family redox-sensing transcriptional regulator